MTYQIDVGVVFGKAFGCRFYSVALQASPDLCKGRNGDQIPKFLSIDFQFFTDTEQVRRTGIPKARGKETVARSEMYIVAPTQLGFFPVKRNSKMGFIRGFVFWKTHVSVNPKHFDLFYFIRDFQACFYSLIKGFYFGFQRFKTRFLGFKPLAGVVLG